jgi:muramoyltetrapeptide carboxypeptidase
MSTGSASLLRPPAVRAGAGISIVAPASSAQLERIEKGVAALRELGFTPTLGRNTLHRGPLYFAGTPEQRLTDLHGAFADENTTAVMCMRGGYGSNYIHNGLDLDLIRKHPKAFFAYSDLTGVQLRLLDELCIPAFHGPMAAADFYLADGVHMESFRSAISGAAYQVGAAEGLRSLRHGDATGTLYGGCLSILVSLLGTPWEPRTEGKLLFLEDVGTKPYQVDRMLWQLRNAGKLEGVRGIIFGEMLECTSPGATPDLLDRAILNALGGFEGPIAIGLRSGHVSRHNVTLTFGVEAKLAAGDQTELHLLQAAVQG